MQVFDDANSAGAPQRKLTRSVLDELREFAFTSLPLPEAYGGQRLGVAPSSTTRLLDVLRATGRRNLAAGRLFEGHINALLLIDRFAADAARDRWFRACRDGAWFGVWNTDGEQNVRCETVGTHQILHGGKRFCSGAGFLDQALITVHNADGTRKMLIVPMADISPERIDRSTWQPLGMIASDSFTVDFTGCRVDETQFFGFDDAYIEDPFFSAGAIRFAAVQLGGTEALAYETAAFLRARKRSLEAFQELRFSDVEIELQAARLLLAQAAQLFDAAPPAAQTADAAQIEQTAETLHAAHIARMAVDRAATTVLATTDRAVGANGYLEPWPFAELHKDLTMYLRQPIPDQITARIGRRVLSDSGYVRSLPRESALREFITDTPRVREPLTNGVAASISARSI